MYMLQVQSWTTKKALFVLPTGAKSPRSEPMVDLFHQDL